MLNGRADEPKPNPAGRPDEVPDPTTDDDEGLSLERLSQAFARAMEGHHERQSPERSAPDRSAPDRSAPERAAGDRPAAEDEDELSSGGAGRGRDLDAVEPDRGSIGRPAAAERDPRGDLPPSVGPADPDGLRTPLDLPLSSGARIDRDVDARCPISPRSIAEAILFVGHPANQPLSSRLMAALMRGVSPAEVDQLVEELNASYRAEQAPYEIAIVPGGFMLQLRGEYSRLRNKLYGRVREARLSQAAIEVLALVAYNQPVGRERIDQLRGKPSGALLSQLVRRDLLSVARSADRPREMVYRTTERFLDIFGLDSLDDLPQADGPDSLEP